MKNCDKCGAANQDKADFCSLCMASFPKTNQPSESSVPRVPNPSQMPTGPPLGGTPKPPPTNIYEEIQKDVIIDGSRIVAPGGPPPHTGRPGLSSTATAVSEAMKERHVELRSSMELFNEAFFFWWENVKFYLLYGLALVGMAMIVINFFTSRVSSIFVGLGTSAASSPEQLAGTIAIALIKIFLVVGLVALIAYAALLTGTVKMAQGYDAGVINSTISGILNLKSILWLIMLQGLATGIVILPLSVLFAMLPSASTTGKLLNTLISGPVLTAVGAPFMMGVFVFLDQGIRGIKAVSTGISLVGKEWGRVAWRFFAFGLFMSVLMFGTQMHPLGGAMALFFAPGMYIIYPWFIYTNLKQMKEARENRAFKETAQTAPSPA